MNTQLQQKPLSGVFVPNVVPFDHQGKLNEPELRRDTGHTVIFVSDVA